MLPGYSRCLPEIYSGVCSWCDALFYCVRPRHIYCSRSCGYLSRKNRRATQVKTCRICGSTDQLMFHRSRPNECKPCYSKIKAAYHSTERGHQIRSSATKRWRNSPSGWETLSRLSANRLGTVKDGSLTAQQWQMVLAVHLWSCAYCGSQENLSVDHVRPISRGGQHNVLNVVPACRRCNSKKGNRRGDRWLKEALV